MNPWYQALYENFSDYDTEPYTQNTAIEAAFIQQQLSSDTKSILDIGCGTGRHALELARKGYTVTGIDLSEDLIRQAKAKAGKLGAAVNFVVQDACKLPFEAEFDAAILMCEGAFSMMETDEKEQLILDGAAKSLRSGGKFILTTTNALFMLAQGNPDFNLLTFREKFTLEAKNSQGEQQTLQCDQRYYTPPELRRMLLWAGFEDVRFFAVTEQGFNADLKPCAQHFEFGAICTKR